MLVFIDLETTGFESTDKICSIALLYEDSYKYELINEGKKISASASSIHHITNEMIQGKQALKETEIYEFLLEYNCDKNVLIMHNALFNMQMLSLSGLEWQGDIIDTQRVAKHLIEDCDSYSLQYMRYELRLYKEEQKVFQKYGIKDALYAHHALSDALLVSTLFNYLHELVEIQTMKELSCKSVLLQKFSFGKYKGRYIEEIYMNDRAYLKWLIVNAKEIDEDMKYSINYYLQG